MTDPSSGEFGKLITRAALHFKEQGGKAGKTAADDFNRPALDQLLQAYATLWQGKIIMEVVKDTYTRRELFPPRFGEELQVALTEFADGKAFELGFCKALAMLAEVELKDLPSCAHGVLMKALGVVINILHAGFHKVGAKAARCAQDIMEIWSFKDPFWKQWSTFYGGKPGQEPLACISPRAPIQIYR